ncbi:FAD-linked oxidase C-terminal domain-containing protein [Colwellia sp. MEBiC06753]
MGSYQLIVAGSAKHQPVLATDYPFYALVEATGNHNEHDAKQFEQALTTALENEIIVDAAMANSESQCDSMWAIRDDIETLIKKLSPLIAFDISLPIKHMEAYLMEVESRLNTKFPLSSHVIFGHLGDSNLHLVVSLTEPNEAIKHQVQTIVYEQLHPIGGSVSAEHGIGLDKLPYIGFSKSPEELALMKVLKQALDPKNLLNPGKVL